jgi:aminoglycoside phosphotransferase (APT) family kinase protein
VSAPGGTTAERDARTAVVVDWVQRHVGPVTTIEMPPRWRAHWFVGVEDGSDAGRVLVRAARADTAMAWPLDHEMRFQQSLHDHGIPVPKVHGWIAELPAMVTEAPSGRVDFTATTDAERDAAVDEYLQTLAQMHRLDIGPFVRAGIDHADDAEGSALIGMRRMEELYRRQKRRPDPFLEWALGWLRRHQPRSHSRQGPVVWDAGQFLHDQGHLVAIIDLEIGHIGDPMMDLGSWRLRDSIIPFGDFDTLYDRYSELSDEPVDVEAIELHHIAFTLTNQLAFGHALKDPPPDTDYATNLQWCNETNLHATESIAEYLGLELPPVEALPERRSRAGAGHAHLVRNLRNLQDLADDPHLRHQLRISFRLARHLARYDEIGDAAIDVDLDDAHDLLGHRPESWEAADAALEDFVLADAAVGRHDEALLHLFHRRNARAQMLNGPAGSAMARHYPIQRFRLPT